MRERPNASLSALETDETDISNRYPRHARDGCAKPLVVNRTTSEKLSPIFADIQVTIDYASAFSTLLLINFQPVMNPFCDLL